MVSCSSPKTLLKTQTQKAASLSKLIRIVQRALSSWGSHLSRRSQSQNPQLATSQPATLPSQEKNDPNQNSEQYRAAAGSSESEGFTSGSSISPPGHAQVAAVEPTTEPSAAKPSVRKSSKRNRSAKHGVVVVDADAWNGRWARRAERRRGFGLFMFRPVPRFMGR